MSKVQKTTDTRTRILAVGSQLFAELGFYGASMDRIARELGLTKQALIHHFGSKEKLYGAVLEGISDHLLEALRADDEDDFVAALINVYQHSMAYREETCLLMRELLDNPRRAAQASTWYLRPFLDFLHQGLRSSPGWQDASDAAVATHVYQLLGAINYFAVSLPTLQSMYSKSHVQALQQAYPDRLRALAAVM